MGKKALHKTCTERRSSTPQAMLGRLERHAVPPDAGLPSGAAVEMPGTMTFCAERDEIFFRVIAQYAARGEVVNLKIVGGSAVLTAPAVALEHLAAQLTIGFRLKP